MLSLGRYFIFLCHLLLIKMSKIIHDIIVLALLTALSGTPVRAGPELVLSIQGSVSFASLALGRTSYSYDLICYYICKRSTFGDATKGQGNKNSFLFPNI